jgi:hypothetical protein
MWISIIGSKLCLYERVKVIMKQGGIWILLLVFLVFVSSPHTALAGGSGGETLSYETVGIITVVTIVVLFGIPYLMKKYQKKPQEKEQEESFEKKVGARHRQKAFIYGGELALIRW